MKLPITPLLYLVSLAALAGIVHAVYKFSDTTRARDPKVYAEIKVKNEELKKKGAATLNNQERWRYGSQPFWKQLETANFTGKVRVEKVVEKPVVEEKAKPKAEIIDLNEVFEVICITRAGKNTGVVLSYTKSVEVPPSEVVSTAPPVTSTIPKGRMKGKIPRAAPVSASVTSPPDLVQLDEALWPPYDFVYLKAVAEDASHVIFELRIPDKLDKEKGYPTQTMLKGQLDLPSDVVELLVAGGSKSATNGEGTSENRGGENENPAASDWVDTGSTQISRDGRSVNVAEQDREFIEKNAAEIWQNDVQMGDYSGGSGSNRIRGVLFKKISSRMQKYGVVEGDVIISINGNPVTGMASAKKETRRLYNSGVRNFKAEVVRRGQVIVLTYSLKK